MLITFSGIDCAGKSTQIQALRAGLIDLGRRSRVSWYRPGYSWELDRLRALVRSTRLSRMPPPGQSEARDQHFASSRNQRRWIQVAGVDAIYHYGAKVRARLLLNQTLLCDRWIDDALIDLRLRFPEQGSAITGLESRLARWAPRPSFGFLFMLPFEVATQRIEAKQEPFPDTLDMRQQRFEAYEELASSGRYILIDATEPIETVSRQIWSHVQLAP